MRNLAYRFSIVSKLLKGKGIYIYINYLRQVEGVKSIEQIGDYFSITLWKDDIDVHIIKEVVGVVTMIVVVAKRLL